MLTKLSDEALMLATKSALKTETKASVNVVRHYFEINRRELHLKRAKPNLFSFILANFEMDTTSVQRRVNAVKLASAVPKLLDYIDEGKLGLSSAADIQTFFNAEQGRKNAYSPEQKRDLVESLLGKTTREIQKILTGRSPSLQFTDSKREIADNQYKITYISSAETEEKYERIKEIRSHLNPYANRDELLNYIFELALEKIDPNRKAQRAEKRAEQAELKVAEAQAVGDEASGHIPAPESDGSANQPIEEIVSSLGEVQYVMNFDQRSRYVPAAERHEVQLQSDGCCYIDAKTGERCGSSHQLQFDHKIEFARGGPNSAENGQMMCGAHNRFKYRQRRGVIRERFARYAG